MISFPVEQTERQKYQAMWSVDDYRKVSFGEQLVAPFMALSGIQPGTRVLDLGCGTGRASLFMARLGMNVTMVDLVPSALDPEVVAFKRTSPLLRFRQGCVWDESWVPPSMPYDWVFCCDVMEHVPVEFTMLTVYRCMTAAHRSFFHIYFDPDEYGSRIGQVLHETVRPFTWWRDRLGEMGNLIEARDLQAHGMFVVESR